MPSIKQDCIEDIRNRVTIYDVVAPHVALKKVGSRWRGLSPFNTEKTPSFFIDPEKNLYYCFSSGQGGDLFRFVQMVESLSFNEAVESIAQRFNIPIEYQEGSRAANTTSIRKGLLKIHEKATEFFHQIFRSDTDEGRAARDYWIKERCFPIELADAFQIGFAPPTENAFLERLLGETFSTQEMARCGLFYAPKDDHLLHANRLRPRFRGRLMIPIRDLLGRAIAFTGRQTSLTPQDDITREAKYINSPETLLFSKSRVLFGLDQARRHMDQSQRIILVEGQLDAIRCWQKGIATAVAPQGTAITLNQLACIRRYTDQIDCLLDGDTAGQQAALRLLPLALKAGLEVRFLTLPAGKDPDQFFQQHGSEKLESLRAQAVSPVAFVLGCLLPERDTASPEAKARALATLYGIIDQTDSLVTRDAYRKEAAQLLECDPHSLMQDFETHPTTHQWPLIPAAEHDPSAYRPELFFTQNKGDAEATVLQKLTSAEYELLWIILHDQKLGIAVTRALDDAWIRKDVASGRLLSRVLAALREEVWEGIPSSDQVTETDEEKNLFFSIMGKEFLVENPAQKTNEALHFLFKYHVREQKRKLSLQIQETQDFAQRQRLQAQIVALRKRIPPRLHF